MARFPKGYKRCDNRVCRDGRVPQYTATEGRMRKTGDKRCPTCNGRGMEPDPRYIDKISRQADDKERAANRIIGTGQENKVRQLLREVKALRDEAAKLKREL